MASKFRERKKGIELGRGWSLLLSPLLVPALLIGAGLSIPYTLVSRRLRRRRLLAFEQEMKSVGRLMEWPDFVREMDTNHGTLILERYSFKGPVWPWWTEDDLYQFCPYPAVDWLTMLKDESFWPLADWGREPYTDRNLGRAFLVASARTGGQTLYRRLHSQGLERGGWIEVVPPEMLDRHGLRAMSKST